MPAAVCRSSMRDQQDCLAVSDMPPHCRISSSVRQQPSQSPEAGDIRQTLMQGDGKSPPLRSRVLCRATNVG